MKTKSVVADIICALIVSSFAGALFMVTTNSEYISGLVHDQFYSSMIWLFRVLPLGVIAIFTCAIRANCHGKAGRKWAARGFHLAAWAVGIFAFFGSSFIHETQVGGFESEVIKLSTDQLLHNPRSKDERFMRLTESELSRTRKSDLMKLVENSADISALDMYRYLRLLNRPRDSRLTSFWRILSDKVFTFSRDPKEGWRSEYLLDYIAGELAGYANDEAIQALESIKAEAQKQGIKKLYSLDAAIDKAKNPPYRIIEP